MAKRVCAAILSLVMETSLAWAQSASISGRIVDAQNAIVVNAIVRLTPAAGVPRVTRTSADGTFIFQGISAGNYTLDVEAPGFVPWKQQLTARPNAPRLDISLQIAGVREAVSVVSSVVATVAEPSPTATRLGLTPLETPASVAVLPGDVIRERGDLTIQDARARAVGVTTLSDPGNGGGDASARGFSGVNSVMQLFDGQQLFVGAGTVTFPFDPWTVDRIEVLGGPSSVLYGTGAIGGVVNVVPRQPNPLRHENSVRIAGGSFKTFRGAFDSTGPINAATSYRLDVSQNHSEGWLDRGGEANSTALSGSLSHQLTPALTVTVSEDYGYQKPETYFGAPTINGTVPELLRKVNFNVGDADIYYKDSWTQGKVDWQAAPAVRVRSRVYGLVTNRHWRDAENYSYDPSSGLVFREGYLEIFHHQQQYGNRSDVLVSQPLFGHANSLSVGGDYNYVRFEHVNNGPFEGSSEVDLANSNPGTFINLAGTFPRFRTRTHHVGGFAEDRLVLTPHVSVVGAVRFDRYAVERLDLVATTTAERTYRTPSWRGGVVVSVTPELSVYGQYATATDTIGNVISNNARRLLLDPTTGRQVEVGVKQSFLNRRGDWTVAAYNIVKEKLLAPVPNNPGVTQQIGQQSSRGIEASVALALPRGVRLEANGTVLNAQFDDFFENVGGVLVSRAGNTPPAIPERLANVWVTWNAPQKWQFRGGVRYVGQRFWDNGNSSPSSAYTVVDAGVRRGLTDRVAVDLYLYNLFDELYAQTFYSSEPAQWLLGRPRAAEVALTVRF